MRAKGKRLALGVLACKLVYVSARL